MTVPKSPAAKLRLAAALIATATKELAANDRDPWSPAAAAMLANTPDTLCRWARLLEGKEPTPDSDHPPQETSEP